MARPRTPSNILELRGSFKKDPQRRRADIEGAGAFDPMPPQTLAQELVPSWHEIVKQIPAVVLSGSDRSSIELMARLLTQAKLTGNVAVIKELRQWFSQYGMTAVGRTKLPAAAVEPDNPFKDA